MKKLSITISILLGMSMTTLATPQGSGLFQHGGGLFQRGVDADEESYGFNERPILPYHELETNQPAAPLGSGIAALVGLGVVYAFKKRDKE